jgi:hypothetical protein
MAETVSLKVLARRILAREREQESLSQGCPKAGETLGQSVGHRVSAQQDALAATPDFARVMPIADGEPSLQQPCAARRGSVQELPDNGAFLHFCRRCGAFAAFGYGVRLRAGQLGRWYCGEHRPAART